MSFREIDDVLWKSIEPHIPPQKPSTGRSRTCRRTLINGSILLLQVVRGKTFLVIMAPSQ